MYQTMISTGQCDCDSMILLGLSHCIYNLWIYFPSRKSRFVLGTIWPWDRCVLGATTGRHEEALGTWGPDARCQDEYRRETFTSRAIIFVIIKWLPRFVFTVEPDQMKERMRRICLDGTFFVYLGTSKKMVYMRQWRFLVKGHMYQSSRWWYTIGRWWYILSRFFFSSSFIDSLSSWDPRSHVTPTIFSIL